MKKIGFVTCQNFPELTDNDRKIQQYLQKNNINAQAVVWSDRSVAWEEYDFLWIRSTWDYHYNPSSFRDWLQTISSKNTKLLNPPEIIAENMHKFYLKKIYLEGFHIIPTEFIEKNTTLDWEEFLNYQPEIIIKPAISLGAYQTHLLNKNNLASKKIQLDALLKNADVLVQPFIPEIKTEGEWSLIFLGGKFSHAVLKTPQKDDFRVQSIHGGEFTFENPHPDLLTQAEEIIANFAHELPYVRIDGVWKNEILFLMELELIEPDLFLYTEPLIERFANIVLEKCDSSI